MSTSKGTPPTTTSVTVLPGWAVHDGTEQRVSGATFNVQRDVASEWISNGWVSETPTPSKPTRSRSAT